MKKFWIICGFVLGVPVVFAVGQALVDAASGLGISPDANISWFTPFAAVAVFVVVIAGMRTQKAATAEDYAGQRLVKVFTGLVTWITLAGMWLYLTSAPDLPWVPWVIGLVLLAVVVIRTVAQERYILATQGSKIGAGRGWFDVGEFRDIEWPNYERWIVRTFAVVWIWQLTTDADVVMADFQKEPGGLTGMAVLPFVACFLWAHPSARLGSLPLLPLCLLIGLGGVASLWALFLLVMFLRLAIVTPTDHRTNFRRAFSSFLASDEPW